ncbi:hypothetical protein Lepto7376_4595 [[Leptolyngbya] sp. PCC 7376]|uniref:DUF6151 family protein n=1 Tax=[Leptolyngbya] sp. PCC 7376 TaxID=111781 RepID=UPI00029F3E47|nr:DUF6151 family protein [[Leptolyngbya] sp. PCC 7376]AFY40685.1 hypothetical protein Lepto7376_4595 [[Leptolyngbya] sp. PCC 7376]
MSYPIQCQCGCLKGKLTNPKATHRLKCYCKDCQAFAHFLGKGGDVLDSQGGTDIVQTHPKYLSFSEGIENLACMKLSETGLLRWYASCCNTPIGNTLPNHKLPFIGIVHNCLESSETSLDKAFGEKSCYVNTDAAIGEPKPKSKGLFITIARNLLMVFKGRLDGSYQQNPMFDAASGEAIATPTVLSSEEYEKLMSTES